MYYEDIIQDKEYENSDVIKALKKKEVIYLEHDLSNTTFKIRVVDKEMNMK